MFKIVSKIGVCLRHIIEVEGKEKNLSVKLLFFENLAFPCLVHLHNIQRCPLLLRKKKIIHESLVKSENQKKTFAHTQ